MKAPTKRKRLQRSQKFSRLLSPEPTKHLPLALPESVYHKVERVAHRLNWSRAQLCRAAIDAFLSAYKEANNLRTPILALGFTAILANSTWAESWVLWSDDTWWKRQHTVGVYPTASACLAGAKPAAEAQMQKVVASQRSQDSPDFRIRSLTQSPPQEVANPPGVRIVVTVKLSIAQGASPALQRTDTITVVTQCWPVGVTPR